MDKSLPTRLAAAATDSAGPMTTGEFANRVAMLTEADSNIHAGELPLWYRLVPAKRASLGSRVFWMMSSCATIALLLAALFRVFDHDGNTLLTWVNAFTAYVYLPAYLVLAAALGHGGMESGSSSRSNRHLPLAVARPRFRRRFALPGSGKCCIAKVAASFMRT